MLHQGDSLRDYEIRSVIGRGGFGIVYKGRHQELEIDVAIKEYFPQELSVRQDGKILPSKPELEASFEDGLVRFLREAQQLEKFRDCPNIVTCRDLFRANGTAYTVMEYVSGLPLSILLEKRESREAPLIEQELLELILPLLKGLQTVHESGICHRDIKPSNILVRRVDVTPILIDFGAAKHEISRHTKSFAPYTDGYAALEQVGEGEIGPWTDIYGLGAVMWRIVAGGAPPFSPPNPLNSQKRAFELMNGRADPLPTARKIGELRFSDKTLQAIDDCLILNVGKRVQNCDELIQRLASNDRGRAIVQKGREQRAESTLSGQAGIKPATERVHTVPYTFFSNNSTVFMTPDKFPVFFHAESAAKRASVGIWYFVGVVLGLIGLLIVYLRSPRVSAVPTNQYDGEDRYIFERSYIDALKVKQIKATWRGLVLGIVFGIFLLWIMIFAVYEEIQYAY